MGGATLKQNGAQAAVRVAQKWIHKEATSIIFSWAQPGLAIQPQEAGHAYHLNMSSSESKVSAWTYVYTLLLLLLALLPLFCTEDRANECKADVIVWITPMSFVALRTDDGGSGFGYLGMLHVGILWCGYTG